MGTPETILKEYFGHSAFRGEQLPLIHALLNGRDVLGVMPTGAGKSICYQVPAMLMPGIALVISPLISLMKDQVGALTQSGIPAACLNSAMSSAEQANVLEAACQDKIRLLYVAPERLSLPGFLRIFDYIPLAFTAVDEAHCISQWGQDFRPSYGRIPDFLKIFPDRPPVGAFTATATSAVRDDIIQLLALNHPLVRVSGFDRPNLTFITEQPRNRLSHLLTLLQERAQQSGIIYCSTRKAVDEVYGYLTTHGFAAGRYHAGLPAAQRRQTQDDFLFDRITIMVATNAFGMGIDKSNVSFVIHYNMPQDIESYYQEAGRAGRDGTPADCILLYSPQDVHTCQFLIEHSHDHEDAELDAETRRLLRERSLERLRQMTFYATTTDCLRYRLLRYFGENPPLSCDNCSNCLTNFEEIDATIDAQKIVSCVFRLHQRRRSVGKSYIADILHGAEKDRIQQDGFDSLSTYGIMKDCTINHIRGLIDRLIESGYLVQSTGEYPVVRLCEKSNDIIRKHLPFIVRMPRDKRQKTAAPVLQSALYETLRALRAKIAAEEGVPAFMIFSNAALQHMCTKKPITENEFLEIPSVGRIKAEKYGEAFTACIKEYLMPAPQSTAAQQIGLTPPVAAWNAEEDNRLRAEAQEKLPVSTIAAQHSRPVSAILARLKLLELPITRG